MDDFINNANKHIEKFLDYYLNFLHGPEYAVLLKGDWGIGKSWYVDQIINKYSSTTQNKLKFLYVSLYGITSFSDIEDTLFQQLHPVLASKKMKLVGKILKGTIKTTLKIDLVGDDKPDGSISASVPDINLPDYLKDCQDYILIFDDLERCNIDVIDVLGYINHFVEHQDRKVIVIANEEKVIEKYSNKYKEIKEKLIGKTFLIKPDFDNAISHFIEHCIGSQIKSFFNNNSGTIKELFFNAERSNLRHIKQALWDFERLYDVLESNIQSKEPLVVDLLKIFLVYSFEIKNNNISSDRIGDYATTSIMAAAFDDEFKQFSQKYPTVDTGNILLTGGIWTDIFDKGIIDDEQINAALRNTKYFDDENTPTWKKLSRYFDLTDTEFDEYLTDVRSKLACRSYIDVLIVKHLAGVFMSLCEKDIIEDTEQSLIDDFKAYIDDMVSNNTLVLNNNLTPPRAQDGSWDGYGFSGTETSGFQAVSQYIESCYIVGIQSKYSEFAAEVMEDIKNQNGEFYYKIAVSNVKESQYFDKPILQYINKEEFISTIKVITPSELRKVQYAFIERYKNVTSFPDLNQEKYWLQDVEAALMQEVTNASGILKYRLKQFKEGCLEKSIKLL
ncbi:MAG: KAP family NTPase [Fibrobacterales bacterium]